MFKSAFEKAWPFLKIALLLAACALVLSHALEEPQGGVFWLVAALLAAAGYGLGALTCGVWARSSGAGWKLTVGLIALPNLLHSVIDGFAVFGGVAAVLIHEVFRQVGLYAIAFEALAPFQISKPVRIASVVASVTGVWILGALAGRYLLGGLEQIESIHVFLDAAAFLLVGDIAHHVIDELLHAKNPNHAH